MMFETIRSDGIPQWRVMYNYINSANPELGQLFPHKELRDILPPGQLKNYYSIVYAAAKHMEEDDQRTLISVRGEGYRYSGGVSQMEKAKIQRDRGKRSLSRALIVADSTDYSLISTDDRKYADLIHNNLSALNTIVRWQHEKLKRVIEEQDALRTAHVRTEARQAATAEEVAELKRRLEELERERRAGRRRET